MFNENFYQVAKIDRLLRRDATTHFQPMTDYSVVAAVVAAAVVVVAAVVVSAAAVVVAAVVWLLKQILASKVLAWLEYQLELTNYK